MSTIVWRIASDTPAYEADDLTGAGAKATGGRWNTAGIAVVYASSSIALACLETFVHLASGGLPLNRYLVWIDVPDDLWAAAPSETGATLRVGWDSEPAGRVSLARGTEWAQAGATALLRLPSVIVPEEHNLLINPAHPDARRIIAKKVRRWLYDPRMSRASSPT